MEITLRPLFRSAAALALAPAVMYSACGVARDGEVTKGAPDASGASDAGPDAKSPPSDAALSDAESDRADGGAIVDCWVDAAPRSTWACTGSGRPGCAAFVPTTCEILSSDGGGAQCIDAGLPPGFVHFGAYVDPDGGLFVGCCAGSFCAI